MTYWNIDSEDGHSISQGIQLEIVARRSAQSTANRLGESVYLYEVGGDGDDGESEIESEEIKPEMAQQDGWIETALNGVSIEFYDGAAVRVSQPADSERSTKDLNDFLRSRYGVELEDSAHGWSQASGEPDVTARLVTAR